MNSSSPKAVLLWLVRLRWGAVLGQLMAIAVASAMTEVPLELFALFSLVGVTVLSNLWLQVFARRASESPTRLVFGILACDVALLTGLLAAAGGSMNPFSVFYLVSVALAGVLLGPRGAWPLAVLTSIGFALLFVLPSGPLDEHSHHMHASPLHLYGMWGAYTLAAGFVAYFVSGIARALRERDLELDRLRVRAARTERLAALATFSAGAAHELGSPLGAIVVAAAELERIDDVRVRDDAQLIRREAERCRAILQDLGRRGGATAGEAPIATTSRVVVEQVAARVTGAEVAVGDIALVTPIGPLVEGLVNLVRNALGVSREVRLEAMVDGANVRWSVSDRGPGFAPEVLADFGEPFVTTRPGEGLGLGLYLTRTFAESVGGRLEVRAAPGGQGSVVSLVVPRDVLEPAA